MKTMERDARWGAAGVLMAVLLLGTIACTRVLEQHSASETTATDATSATLASNGGYLGEVPTEPPVTTASEGAAAAPRPSDDGATAEEARLRVHEIRLGERDNRQALILVLSRPPNHVRTFALANPNRVVIDLDGPLGPTSMATHTVAAGGVARVRIGTHDSQLRVVADVTGALPGVTMQQDGRTVVALLGLADGEDEKLVYRAPGVSTTLVADAPQTIDDTAAPHVVPVAAQTVVSDEPAAGTLAQAEPSVAPTHDDVAPGVTPDVASAPAADPSDTAADAAAAATDPAPATVADVPAPPPPVRLASADRRPEPTLPEDTYALPVQAKSKSSAKKTTRSIDGGTISATPPPMREPHEYTGQRISLDFKDADIQNVLRILADVSGLNIITTEEVQGKLTMRLIDVPWDQAFDAILRAKNLDSVREGNIIRVSTVEQLKKERDAQRAADEAQRQVEPLEVKYIKVSYAKADEKLVKKIQEVLTDRGSATWDERTNTIVVRDIGVGVANATELVRNFDTQTPQVLIESNIVEAQESFSRDLGIQWGYSYKAGPGTGNSTGVNFPGKVDSGGVLAGAPNSPATGLPFIADFPAAISPGLGSAYDLLLGSIDGSQTLAARLTALEKQGKVKIISRPRVVTLNNLAATIESLRILRVRLPSTGTVISTGAGGVAGSAQNATEQIKTGITLTVTPQVSSDGFIFLDVFAKSSTTAPSSVIEAGISIPDEVSRQAESHVLIRNGETFVLGGVFQDNLQRRDNGIPYLRSIPVLGWAFKDHVDQDDRQELLVFVTPRTIAGRGTEDVANLPSAETLWQNRPH